MNSMVTDVMAAFGNVSVNATSVKIDRAGVILPHGQHFQGIQRLAREGSARLPPEPPLLVITSSSDSQGYFVACEMSDDLLTGRAFSPVTMALSPLTHAGGCQAVDHYLVAGLECPATNRTSEIQFWDFKRFPVRLIPMTVPRSGEKDVSTAGACGLTSFGNGAALAVATFNAESVDFYTSTADPFAGSPLIKQFTWTKNDADTTGWIDGNFAKYQNVNLLTQATDGQVFMIGFNRNGADEDWMDLFSVNLDPDENARFALKKLAKKHMTCTDGCSFDAGAGISILSPDGFEVFAVNGKSGDFETGTTIHVNRFPAI